MLKHRLAAEKPGLLGIIRIVRIMGEGYARYGIDHSLVVRRQHAECVRTRVQPDVRVRNKEPARDGCSDPGPVYKTALNIRVVGVVVAVDDH